MALSWDLATTESVEGRVAVGSNTGVDARGAQVRRVLPRFNDDVNEEWLNDKSRFAADGLSRRRLDRPLLRQNGKLVEVEWREAFDVIVAHLEGGEGKRIAAIAGDLVHAEAMLALQDLMTAHCSSHLE